VTQFRRRFSLSSDEHDVRLHVRALKVALVQLDGHPIGEPQNDRERWKEEREFALADTMRSGNHLLVVGVMNWNGHSALLAWSGAPMLDTDSSWEASADGWSWTPAVSVDARVDVDLARDLPTPLEGIADHALVLGGVFALVFGLTFAASRAAGRWSFPSASQVRWLLIGAWLVLAVNNIGKLPSGVGSDVSAHLEYVRYVVDRRAVPLANDGWEMFQPPLYYLLSAPLAAFLSAWHGIDLEHGLRVLPLACGAFQTEIAYRTMKVAFPHREDAQKLGLLVAGLLPMNLYVSQAVGNEPLSGVLSAYLILACLRAVAAPSAKPLREACWIGGCLGLALLAKESAAALIPVAAGSIAWTSWRARGSSTRVFGHVSAAAACALLIAGWWYARNWIELGKPIIGNWDWKEVNRIWWQDPGYRTPFQFERFGRALSQPVFAAVDGFWDALYSSLWADGTLSGCAFVPPWNVGYMAACAWLAVPITAAIALGIVSSAGGAARGARLLVNAALLSFFLALVWYFLHLPIYTAAKSTYAMALVPCFGLLAANGLRLALDNAWTRALVFAWVSTLGASSYLAYFVV
jgi:hypothetical protein